MIRLGHIEYSNCVPVHALLLDSAVPGLSVVRDVPAGLNEALAAGRIDAAPCSSIEYARHPGEYRILAAHAIGSAGAVQSILLESTVPLDQLSGRTVLVPTASATSVVLLRALLELHRGVTPHYEWYDQADASTGPRADAAAVLRIGDVALRHMAPPGRLVLDLGEDWMRWTGMPFAFAVWQVRRELPADSVRRLAALLAESRAYFNREAEALAARHAPSFGLTPARLLGYWQSLRFDLDTPMQAGLLHFYRLAAQLGEAPVTEGLDIVGFELV